MGLSGRSWCHFVVFTQKCLQDHVNPNTVTVNFGKGSFDSLIIASVKFWFGHLLTEVLTRRLCHESEASTVITVRGNVMFQDHMTTCMQCV